MTDQWSSRSSDNLARVVLPVGDQRLELVPPLENAQNLRIELKKQFANLSHPPQVAVVGPRRGVESRTIPCRGFS
jgi:hypothetical protein